ncbi:MAG: type 1 glutamine amidotransferase domain-containing protein [Egibacteraceae bacterium]
MAAQRPARRNPATGQARCSIGNDVRGKGLPGHDEAIPQRERDVARVTSAGLRDTRLLDPRTAHSPLKERIVTKVLMVLTSHEDLGDTGRKTGFSLPEAAHPWKVFTDAGYSIDFVSPKGGEAPMDGVDLSDPVQQAFLNDADIAAAVRDTLTPEQVDPHDYDIVFYAGGHGTMWDFPDNAALAKIAADVYERGGTVAAVCHGPAGLVNIRLSDDSHLIQGKAVSAFTNEEEAAIGLAEVVPNLAADQAHRAWRTSRRRRELRRVCGRGRHARDWAESRLCHRCRPARRRDSRRAARRVSAGNRRI